MQNRDVILPIKGLNKDDSPKYFEDGDYSDARNVIIGNTQDQLNRGLIQSLKSTLLLEIPELVSVGLYHHMGVVVDENIGIAYILSLIYKNSVDQKFVIIKHKLSDNSIKYIYEGIPADWGLTYTERPQFYNVKLINSNIVFTDNKNDIRMMDVVKIENTTNAGITSKVVNYNLTTGYYTGYTIGSFVYYNDSVYKILQSTVGIVDIYPGSSPSYFQYIAKITDVYLDPTNLNIFILAAIPPLISPTAEYQSDSSNNINQLRGQVWQFSYRYVYMDYRKSTYAPPSIIPTPNGEEDVNGIPNPDPTHNNRIKVVINTGNSYVRYIEVVARSSEDPATWFLIKKIDVINESGYKLYPSDQSSDVYFYNDVAKQAIDLAEFATLFSYVPIKAKHMELIENNRLVFANITEGYDRITPSVNLAISYEDLGSITTQATNLSFNLDSDKLTSTTWVYHVAFRIPTENPGACTFYIKVKKTGESSFTTVSYAYSGTDSYPSTVISGLQSAINTEWGSGTVVTCITPESNKLCAFTEYSYGYDLNPMYNWTIESYYEKSTITGVDKFSSLKKGATHNWGIIYRDSAGRISPVIGAGTIKKYIPFSTESATSNYDNRPIIQFTINHLPPDWAESYEIVYAGNNSVSWFLDLLGYNFCYGKYPERHTDPDASTSIDTSSPQFRLRIKKAQSNTRNYFDNWSVEEYVWQKGDRIRIIGTVDSGGNLTELDNVIYDVEITGVYEDVDYDTTIGEGSTGTEEITSEWIYFKVNSTISVTPTEDASPNLYPDNLFVEIYRPSSQLSETLYYTTGMTYNIYESGGYKYHGGQVAQVLNASGDNVSGAIVNNTANDIWIYLRQFRNISNNNTFRIWSESQYPDDYYQAQLMTSQGNPIPNIENSKQTVLTKRLRHGGIIRPGTEINELSKFDYNDFLDLKDTNGPIEGIRYIGFVLKAIQKTKVTSIYIGRQESYTASGDQQYLFTDQVFGTARPEMTDWGTTHPDSVEVYNRQLYFWDQSEGLVVRDSANGQFPLSAYKMKKWFSDKARDLDSASYARVKFFYVQEFDQLYCLFQKNSDTSEIAVFSESDSRWKYFIDLPFDRGQFYYLGKRLYHAHNEFLFDWWKGTGTQDIGDSTQNGSIEFYSKYDLSVKTFDAIIVYQTGRIPSFTEVSIPADASENGSEMSTNIYDANIKQREGVYYCQILRDVNTPNKASTNDALMNGDRMRGQILKIKMNFPNVNSLIKFANVIILSTVSERHK